MRPRPGPFPIRTQTAADLEAARFDLLAWHNPWDEGGPSSPFWDQSGMVEAVLAPHVEPLARTVAADRGSISVIAARRSRDRTRFLPWGLRP